MDREKDRYRAEINQVQENKAGRGEGQEGEKTEVNQSKPFDTENTQTKANSDLGYSLNTHSVVSTVPMVSIHREIQSQEFRPQQLRANNVSVRKESHLCQ